MDTDLTDTKVPYIIDLKSIGSPEIGYITVAEFPSVVPFEIQRTYWTCFTPHDVERGNHAHKKLEQLIVAVSGTIDLSLESRNGESFSFKLDHPGKGLYIPRGYWRKIRFSQNAVLLCMASLKYDKDDYIRDYTEFKNTDFI